MAKASTAVTKARVNLPVDVEAQIAAEIAAIQKRISAPSGDRIGVTQSKKFRFPDGAESDTFEAIIVDFVAANFYYDQAFDRDNIVPPTCFAIGLEPSMLMPSDNSPDKQCEACAGCWANQFKSADNKKGKACSNTFLLAVLPPDADVDTPVSIVKVAAKGTPNFSAHVSNIANKLKLPVRGVVTQLAFSDGEDYPVMTFAVLGKSTPDQFMQAQNRLEEARTRLMTEPDVSAAAAPVVAAKAKPAAKRPAARRAA